MANIRTLSDLAKDDEESQLLANHPSSRADSEDIGNRGMAISVLEMIFPHITWKSSLWPIVLAQITLYTFSLIKGTIYFGVPSASALLDLGANVGSFITRGEIWRLITPIFLHASILHILFNIFFQLRMGFPIERKYGIPKFVLLFFFTGLTGNLLSAATVYCSLKVGASTSGYGLIGLQLAELALFWHLIRHRERIILNTLSYFLITCLLLFSMNGGQIDVMGHIGGLIGGFCMGIFYNFYMDYKPHWFTSSYYSAISILTILICSCSVFIFIFPQSCS